MSRRERWRQVLDSEMRRWSALRCDRWLVELRELQEYEVEFDSRKYQVEVEILENTDAYVQVVVAVDDGRLPASIVPASGTFVRRKREPPA